MKWSRRGSQGDNENITYSRTSYDSRLIMLRSRDWHPRLPTEAAFTSLSSFPSHFMSLLVRVELPTYSHSFQVSVPSTGTINDVKCEIENVCVGNPRVQGQRLIWRGRFLGDNEKVLDIWKVRRPC
jgi:hypothetical protein